MVSCQSIYYAIIPACSQSIEINAGLEVNTEYDTVITDKHGNQYVEKYISDENGIITIETERYPVALFNEHAGSFRLEISKDNCTISPLICGVEYNAISFQTIRVYSDDIHAKIGFCNECE